MTLIRVGVVGEIHEDYKIILVVNFILPLNVRFSRLRCR